MGQHAATWNGGCSLDADDHASHLFSRGTASENAQKTGVRRKRGFAERFWAMTFYGSRRSRLMVWLEALDAR
jgi:hypothetical protein